MSKDEWLRFKEATPVRVQWDPERDLQLQPQTHRAVQIGLGEQAVALYVGQWIKHITDITSEARDIHALVLQGKLDVAQSKLPLERPYCLEDISLK